MAKRATKRQNGADTATRTAELVVPSHGRGRLVAPWQPGQSGNPTGFVDLSVYLKVRAICAENSEEAAHEQVRLMSDDDARIRFMATEAVLNRGVGKPRDHSDDEKNNTRINLSGLSSDELTSLGALLKKALGL